MKRVRTTFQIATPPVNRNPNVNEKLVIDHVVSCDVDITMGKEMLNKVFHVQRHNVGILKEDGQPSSVTQTIKVEIRDQLEMDVLENLLVPPINNEYAKLLNARTIWDLSRKLRIALNVSELSKPVEQRKLIEVGIPIITR